jgi:hypothetical protein
MRKRQLPPPEPTPDGFVWAMQRGRTVLVPIASREVACATNLHNPLVPHWKKDPTYNLKRKPKP